MEQSDTSGNGTGQQQTLIWRRLAEEAVQRDQLDIAERAFAAAGDLVNAAFVRRCVSDRSDVALLSGNFEAYESANSFDHVIDTYKRLQMWNEAIVFAEKQQQIERATELRSEYAKQLMESGDRVKAAELAEQTGDYSEAIRLYMSCNHLLAATRCVRRHDRQVSASIRDQLIDRLKQKRMYAAAGELYEMQAQQSSASSDCLQQALQCYEMGEHYEQCVRLARNHFPADVVRFEKVFGQQLAARGRPAASISHLIEAGETALALESALAADRLQQAADLAIALGESIESDLCQRVAERLVTSGQVQKAVQVCVQCGRCTEAVQLLLRQGLYEMAFKVARERMSVEQVNDQFERLSRTLVTDEKLAEAEQVLVAAGLIDQAVQIYRQAHQYESMLRLVARHKPNQLMDTRLALASELAALGRLEEAETHFVAANQWKAAVQAYSRVGQWSNAYRLARAYGGAEGASQVAFVWARECDSAADAVQLLDRLKQLEPVLEQAQASGAFEFALAVAQSAPQLKGHVSQVQTRWAVALQKQGKRDAAESLWLDAGKLREAVTMRLQANEFDQALVLADRFGRDVSLWRDVCTAYLRYTLSGTNGEMLRSAAGIEPLAASVETIVSRVEQLSIRASRPEMALNLLLENRWFQRAANFASNHAPHLIDTVQRATTIGNKSSAGDSSIEDRDPSDRPIVSRRTSTSNQPIDHETLQQLSDKLIQISRHGTREQLLTAANALARAQKQLGQWNQSLRTLQQHAAVFLMPDARLLLLDIGRVLFTIQSFSDDEISDWKLLRDVLTAAYNSTEQSIGAESDPLIDEQISHQLQLAHYLHLKSVLANIGRNPIAGEIHDKICISILR